MPIERDQLIERAVREGARRERVAREWQRARARAARREVAEFLRRLVILLGAIVLLVAAGTIAFVVAEGASVGWGLVWTLDTLTTVGSIPEPASSAGQAIKVVLEVLGVGTLFYALVTVTEFLVSGRLSGLLEERRVQKTIDSLGDHYLICGFGRVGRQVAMDLRASGARYVVIDDNPENEEEAKSMGAPYIDGRPSDDETLRAAGIMRARAVVACVDSDAENIFIALTARELRDDILIVARASSDDSDPKLRRAGADRVISPYKTSGAAMARIALHPQIARVGDVDEYRIEEIEVTPSCAGAGHTIGEVRGGSLIVALRHADGRLEPTPGFDTRLEPGAKLVALGTTDALEQLEVLFQPATAAATAS